MIRLATPDDAAAVAAIYAPIVRETAISFEVEPPDPDSMRRRIEATLEHFPWLVCERDARVTGYAYAAGHRERAAYRWSVDVSVYVAEACRGRGVGRALYSTLLDIVSLQGAWVAHAGITLPNLASVRLHERLGFEPVGVYRAVGHKLGAWHDVGWWRLQLGELPAAPGEPRSLSALAGDTRIDKAFSAGAKLLR